MTLLELVDEHRGLLDEGRPVAAAVAMALAIFPAHYHPGDALLLMKGRVSPGWGYDRNLQGVVPEWMATLSANRRDPLMMCIRALSLHPGRSLRNPYMHNYLIRDVAAEIDRLVDVLVEPARTAALCVLGPKHKEHPPVEAVDPHTARTVFAENQLALSDLLDRVGSTGQQAATHLRDGRTHNDTCWVRHWLTAEVFRI